MKIKVFIQTEVILPRLQRHGVLVVYDPERRYRDLCAELASPVRRVIDASEGSIDSRAQALAALQELGEPHPKLHALLVYVPARPPRNDEERQRDPFAAYAACGAAFPEGDGDEYLSLCLQARPDHATEIRRIFADNHSPDFAVIDAVGGGASWPHLQALLQVESARDILAALLVPSATQEKSLKGQDAWLPEARDLFQRALGLKLLTKGKSWSAVADELWRFTLFSDFAFDLPGAPATLPAELANVPRAAPEARPIVEYLCDRLRNDVRTQPTYIDRAGKIEQELNLPAACAGVHDLGVRDTFPFEERSLFTRAVAALADDDLGRARDILTHGEKSVWVGRGETQAGWSLLRAATDLLSACAEADRHLPDHVGRQDGLLDYYASELREVDRLQRELEQSAGDQPNPAPELGQALDLARKAYRRVAGRAQESFIAHLETAGWPPSGRLANANVFDRFVAPRLAESGQRVAYLLIDALRYELGVELHKQLAEDGRAEVQPACASLPTVTRVGMASLLPGAEKGLRLTRKNADMVPSLDDQALPSVTQRMGVLQLRYGQRFAQTTLKEFLGSKYTPPDGVELLVVRTTAIDTHLENSPAEALPLLYSTLRRVRAALGKLSEHGFRDAVIATDHGFFLNLGGEPGEVCPKPPGTWVCLHDRCLLGEGSPVASNFVLPAAKLGVRGDFGKVAGPRGLVAYSAGAEYFHGGASLQEAVVPVITVRLHAAVEREPRQTSVKLAYKDGAKRVTTRLPVIKVTVEQGLYATGAAELLLEAHDRKGNVVGEARPGSLVNPATRIAAIDPGKTELVTLKMDAEFEGKFTVKALDPTTLAAYFKLDLETDYTV